MKGRLSFLKKSSKKLLFFAPLPPIKSFLVLFFKKGLLILLLPLAVWAADRVLPPNLSRLAATSPEVVARDGQLLTVFPAPGGIWRLRTAVGDVDRRYIDVLIAAEDRRFFTHDGVDPGALLRAAWQYARAGRIVSGGSTLSMQTARLLEPHRRGVFGKLHDIVRAWQLEAHYSKPQILGMYLTLAPMGGNIEGVRAASFTWFGHGPAHLSRAEAAMLAALPQSPARRRPDRFGAAAAQAGARLLARLGTAGNLPAFWSGGADFAGLAAGLRRHDMPHEAALFCAGLVRAARRGSPAAAFGDVPDAAPAANVIRSTIDAGLQARLEGQIGRAMVAEDPAVGVAMLAVDNASREVRASVGGRGPGFAGSALDLTRRRRSPGSALKPFIYGMGFDALLLHPLTEIDDAPGLVAGYAPHNFDYLYHGGVSAQVALRQSFNVPAVQVLSRVGPERFIAGLRQAGARIALPGRHASLAVALGGLGISLSDMVMLYEALGDDGHASALVTRMGEIRGDAPFMGPLAVYYLREILEGSPPPPGMAYATATGGRSVAFKTGTSYGFRDAWAVGYSARWTVGVWTGRVEGTPRPGAYGRATAAPLMLDAFALLPPEPASEVERPPGAITVSSNAELPAGLRRLGGVAAVVRASPVLDYPPAGSTIDLVATGRGYVPVTLRARGGEAPYRWVVNGVPQAGHGSELPWTPDGVGFAVVTLIDANDRATRGRFRLE